MEQYLSRLTSSMYGPDLPRSISPYGLNVHLASPGWLTSTIGAFVAATAVAGTIPDVVVASACVDHCEADPSRLAATVLADLVHGAAVANLLDRPLLSMVCVGEEINLVPGGNALAPAWTTVAEHVRYLFNTLAVPKNSLIIYTSDPDLWRVLNEVAGEDRADLLDQELDGLYQLLDGSAFPRGTPFTYFYDYYRLNIAHYRRKVIERLMGPAPSGVLVVENLQQAKAVAMARALNDGWPTEQLATLPSPGLTGVERATRTGDVRLSGLLDDPMTALASAAPDVRSYWRTVDDLYRRSTAEGKAS